MAYDNEYRGPYRERDGRDRDDGRGRGQRDQGGRGFFERAGDEVASWFGDEDAEHRRARDDRDGGTTWTSQDRDQDRMSGRGDDVRGRQDREGWFGSSSGSHDRDRNAGGAGGRHDADRQQRPRDSYRPVTGDYGRSESSARPDNEPQRAPASGRHSDPHYSEWRQRQIDALDRDYDEYRREHQSKFENDFSGWRTQRQSKREILSTLRDGMEVVGSDEQRVGTVDKVKDDRVILRKNDPEAGGVHRSFGCGLIDRLDGDRLILNASADSARGQLQREDRGEAYDPQHERGGTQPRADVDRDDGPHVLERSFSGTYR